MSDKGCNMRPLSHNCLNFLFSGYNMGHFSSAVAADRNKASTSADRQFRTVMQQAVKQYVSTVFRLDDLTDPDLYFSRWAAPFCLSHTTGEGYVNYVFHKLTSSASNCELLLSCILCRKYVCSWSYHISIICWLAFKKQQQQQKTLKHTCCPVKVLVKNNTNFWENRPQPWKIVKRQTQFSSSDVDSFQNDIIELWQMF